MTLAGEALSSRAMAKRVDDAGDGNGDVSAGAAPLPIVAGEGADGTTLDFGAILGISDLLPVMIAVLDKGLCYRFVNKPYAQWHGRPRSEILGRTVPQVIGEAAYEERRELLEAALAGERQFFVSTYDHPERGALAVQAEYIPQPGADGQIAGIAALITDVTEQRAAELALRESEERFRRIANQAPVLMWVTRIDRTRDFVNDAYVEFVGCKREKARTIDWRSRIHPDDVDRIVAESIAGEASMQTFTLEGRYLRGDGEYRWLRSVSSPRFGPDGEHVGFIGAATDITVAKEAELKLKRQVEERTARLAQSEAQFRAIFDTVLEVLVLMRPNGTIVQLNRKREMWRDPNGEQAVGRKIWEAPTLQNYPQHVPLMRRAVKTAARGEIFSEEVKMEREGVPTAYIDVFVQPVRNDAGEVIYLLFEARDVTELKAAQEQLRQSQKMEALGQLTGGIAHDFNNLLTVVVGGLDLIAKRVEDAKLKTYAANALAAAERGARLTGQLLAFSRVQRLEVRPTLVAPLIEEMRPLLRNVLGPGIEKTFDLRDATTAIMADPTQLELAVLNLAINARDAMPDGGVLTFSTRKLEIANDPELAAGEYVELSIGDTGTGMTEEVRSRAFEPFFTTKEVGKGTGLGLSMVYGVARQSGGTARISSSPENGTCVRLYFRCADGPQQTNERSEAKDAKASAAGPASVLVIDDDPDVRGFIAESLGDLGYEVRTADSGSTGLAEFANRRPDVVVLDFVMPGQSGADVARQMLAENPKQPILFVSGYSETEAIRQIAPRAPLLAKPFRAETLDHAVRKTLSNG